MSKLYCETCNDAGELVENGKKTVPCQDCCPHDEFDHYMCLDCGYEKDPGEDIDRAMDALEDR